MDFSRLKEERKQRAEEEINQSLNKEADILMTTKWNKVLFANEPVMPLPDWFIEDYKKAVMDTSPKQLEILSHQLFLIGQSKVEDIMFGQVGIVINAFTFARPMLFCDSFDLYIEKRKELDKIMLLHTEIYRELEKKLITKKKFMLAIYDTNTWEKKSTSKFHA